MLRLIKYIKDEFNRHGRHISRRFQSVRQGVPPRSCIQNLSSRIQSFLYHPTFRIQLSNKLSTIRPMTANIPHTFANLFNIYSSDIPIVPYGNLTTSAEEVCSFIRFMNPRSSSASLGRIGRLVYDMADLHPSWKMYGDTFLGKRQTKKMTR